MRYMDECTNGRTGDKYTSQNMRGRITKIRLKKFATWGCQGKDVHYEEPCPDSFDTDTHNAMVRYEVILLGSKGQVKFLTASQCQNLSLSHKIKVGGGHRVFP